MMEDEKYERAKSQVSAIKGFYRHLTTYVAVIALLFFFDIVGGEGWWFYWAAIGWGFAVILHGASVGFGIRPFGTAWEEKKIKEIMEKEKKQ